MASYRLQLEPNRRTRWAENEFGTAQTEWVPLIFSRRTTHEQAAQFLTANERELTQRGLRLGNPKPDKERRNTNKH